MQDKFVLTQRVIKILLANDFNVLTSKGCFDIAAKREYTLIIKTILNIDGLLETHAKSMKILSNYFSLIPLVISLKNNRERLQNNIIYSRFDLPVITPQTLETLLFEDSMLYAYSIKGKHLVNIDTKKMRKKRLELGLTMKQLAEKVGVTLKTIYLIENNQTKPTVATVEMLEEILNENLRVPYKFEKCYTDEFLEPKTNFEKEISKKFETMKIQHSFLCSTPINIVSKKKKIIAAGVNSSDKKLKSKTNFFKSFITFFNSMGLFIVEGTKKENIDGIPIIQKPELNEIQSFRELLKLIKERAHIPTYT
jgi:putative transcriptional regulator